ncbi:MAG: cobalamin biosynthesis protein CbiX [Gammaproteobacteria bacterium]|nr:cobalamin biosynthesis protein CbiX [Gammaproteobacteria bacterium]
MRDPVIILADNGSTRAGATLSLRRIAGRLSSVCERPVHAVSLQHVDRIPIGELDGEPALVLADFLREQLERGRHWFVIVPLFFGSSRALSSFIPEQVRILREQYAALRVDLAEPLVPLPQGEPRLAAILADNVASVGDQLDRVPDRIVLVDHGSPLPQVTAVREYLARELATLEPGSVVEQAVMERRTGREYDFNGELLEEVLQRLASEGAPIRVVLAMLFLSPGRHAGPGGDIEEICVRAMQHHPNLQVVVTPLIGEHPRLAEILNDRLSAVLTG